jgi:hypothetical protein
MASCSPVLQRGDGNMAHRACPALPCAGAPRLEGAPRWGRGYPRLRAGAGLLHLLLSALAPGRPYFQMAASPPSPPPPPTTTCTTPDLK